MLYFDHPSSLEHDPAALSPDHRDVPERIHVLYASIHQGDRLRDAARTIGVRAGALLEGGYDATAPAESTVQTIAALGGAGEAKSIAPDPFVTAARPPTWRTSGRCDVLG